MFPGTHTTFVYMTTAQERRACAREVVMQDFIPTKGIISWFHWLEQTKEEKQIIEISCSQWEAALSHPFAAHGTRSYIDVVQCEAVLEDV